MKLIRTKTKKCQYQTAYGHVEYPTKTFIVELTEAEYMWLNNLIKVNALEYNKLMEALSNPDDPNDALKELMKYGN